MNWTKSSILSTVPGIVHGFADRTVKGAESDLAVSLGLSGGITRLRQIHSSEVKVINDNSVAEAYMTGDALVTRLRGVGIGVSTADCVPVLLADDRGEVAAAVHAGWRGTLSQIVDKTLGVIKDSFGITPERMIAVIGPSARNCCYEVGEDVAFQFREKYRDNSQYLREKADSKFILDLALANESALERSGVKNIEIMDICTICNDNFYSYRREGKGVGSQLSVIGLV
ncbi:MAG: peptidoglycan editing factor PgeF [Deltaproteobacteria bacterium]